MRPIRIFGMIIGGKREICKQMKKFGYSEKTIDQVELNYDNLDDDLKSEGYINKKTKMGESHFLLSKL